MKTFFMAAVLLGFLMSEASAEPKTYVYPAQDQATDELTQTEDAAIDAAEPEGEDGDSLEEEATDIQTRLEKARAEEQKKADARMKVTSDDGSSGLTKEQIEKLNQESSDIPTARTEKTAKSQETKNKYSKPKHDWSFKKRAKEPEQSPSVKTSNEQEY